MKLDWTDAYLQGARSLGTAHPYADLLRLDLGDICESEHALTRRGIDGVVRGVEATLGAQDRLARLLDDGESCDPTQFARWTRNIVKSELGPMPEPEAQQPTPDTVWATGREVMLRMSAKEMGLLFGYLQGAIPREPASVTGDLLRIQQSMARSVPSEVASRNGSLSADVRDVGWFPVKSLATLVWYLDESGPGTTMTAATLRGAARIRQVLWWMLHCPDFSEPAPLMDGQVVSLSASHWSTLLDQMRTVIPSVGVRAEAGGSLHAPWPAYEEAAGAVARGRTKGNRMTITLTPALADWLVRSMDFHLDRRSWNLGGIIVQARDTAATSLIARLRDVFGLSEPKPVPGWTVRRNDR